jgi:CelD/BcsL family acetyltransferase involved in cellulose biosynthesis
MAMRVERLSGPDALETIALHWDEIDAKLSPRTPFTSPQWAKLWWKHLRRSSLLMRHEFFAHVVRDDSGQLIAVVPLVITHLPSGDGPRIRILQFFGAGDSSITELRGVICQEKHLPEVIQALRAYLQDCKQEWDLVLWNGIRTQDVPYHENSGLLKIDGQRPTYVVPLPQSWTELRSRLSPNMKEAVRKSYKLLAREGHAFTFHVIDQVGEVPAALDRFLTLHAARAGASKMPRHPNYFAQPARREFFVDLSRHMAQAGKLRIFELEVCGKIVASRVAFLLGEHLYFYYSGFDPAWRKYHVMTTLMCECMKWAIEGGIQFANLSTGKDPSKLRWKPTEIVFHDAIQRSATARGRLAFLIHSVIGRSKFGGLGPPQEGPI